MRIPATPQILTNMRRYEKFSLFKEIWGTIPKGIKFMIVIGYSVAFLILILIILALIKYVTG